MHRRCSVFAQPRVVCIACIVFMFLIAVSEMHPTVPSTAGREKIVLRHHKGIDAIKQRILADLGLSRVPDVSSANVSDENMKNMIELYKRSIADSDNDDVQEAVVEEEDERPSVERIRSFPAKEMRGASHGPSLPFHQKFLITVGETSRFTEQGALLKSAKLRIKGFRTGQNPKVVIYKVMYNSSSFSTYPDLVISYSVQSKTPYLVDADIVDGMRMWVMEPTSSLELVVELHNCSISSGGMAASDESNQDLAVLDVLVSESLNRVKRSNPIPYDFSNDTSLDCTQGFRTKMCCRRSLKLSFDDLGWDWIIKPALFEIFYCKGKCHSESLNFANTHALMQSILHLNARRVPNPCCAPKKFKSMTMLHYDDSDPPKLVLTKQKGMIVKECACT